MAVNINKILFLLCIFTILIFRTSTSLNNGEAIREAEAIEYLQSLETQYSQQCHKQMEAKWEQSVDVTPANANESIQAMNNFMQFQSSVQKETLQKFSNWSSFTNATVRREFKYLLIKGPAAMEPSNFAQMNTLMSYMESSYATATVCDYNNTQKCDLRLEAEIQRKLESITDYDETAYYWTAWHDTMAKAVSPSNYTKFIKFQNEYSKANNFKDMSELWLEPYNDESPNWSAKRFQNQIMNTWITKLKPVYRKLHAYVRMKLRKDSLYSTKIKKYGYLPANLMGSMWGQNWASLDARTKPYADVPSLDATVAMQQQNYTVMKIFHEADKYFQGIGLPPMTKTFWERSLMERPSNRTMECHPSAYDLCLGKNSTDFRIKTCAAVNMEGLLTAYQQMGHIAYFMQYTNQEYIFREGANPGFHEAIGDAIALSMATPKYLECVLRLNLGLDTNCDEKSNQSTDANRHEITRTDMNFLYLTALRKIPFLPFAISVDQWRWEVFDGSLKEEDYNKRWWELRKQNQGIVPPETRDAGSFDPAANYNIVANIDYIRSFVGYILQFQFYEAMCIQSGEYKPNDPYSKPLHLCSFAGNKDVGKNLGDMMKLGLEKPWPEALEKLTGSRELSVESLLRYFAPLIQLFDEELTAASENDCFGRDCQAVAAEYINGHYEREASAWCNKLTKADWNYNTDLNNSTAEDVDDETNLQFSKFDLNEWIANISQYDFESFDDTDLTKRQMRFMYAVGSSALPAAELKEYNHILSNMTKIYSNAKICPYHKQKCDIDKEGLPLDPNLGDIMAHSTNYDELSYVWVSWRDAAGKPIRDIYQRYAELSNAAAKLNGYANQGDFWLLQYESDTFREEVAQLWEIVKPLYEELHAYVRFRLRKGTYPEISPSSPIPAHILGNMWAQDWENVYDKVLPYEGFPSFDITAVLKEKFKPDLRGVRDMFWIADDFFVSTGLANVSMAYGDKAMIVKPENKSAVCHASAWDFCDKEDFRIKMCTNVATEDFITIHHELGHIQYYIQYKDLPITLREGANPGFHEAIGDVIALSVATPKHMQKIGFLNATTPSAESTVNYLMKMALDKVAFLPFGYLIDSYRWKIFNGSITQQNYTHEWLKMRATFQGVVPPVARSEQDFDAGAKYHVPADTPYLSYFVSHILQFQIHKELCQTAGELVKKPLYECDIYGNKAAGEKFKKLLQAGASKNWKILLNEFAGNPDLDATALLEYFQPLRNYLKDQRQTHGYPLGWDPTTFEKFYNNNSNPHV